jgi:Zn-dependent protease
VFIQQLLDDPLTILPLVLLIMFSICTHEFAHAWVALKQGDSTAADAGHLTLNPMVQMGPLSIIVLLIAGIAWGQVPVRPQWMRHRYSHALVAFAGPATNMLIALVCLLAAVVFLSRAGEIDKFSNFLLLGAVMNVVLALFNLLPVPPLDGFTVASFFLPQLERTNTELRNAGMFIVLVGFVMVSGKIFAGVSVVLVTLALVLAGLLQPLLGA